eukprot:1352322-Amorphochlora_amoeboformis.AAC.1
MKKTSIHQNVRKPSASPLPNAAEKSHIQVQQQHSKTRINEHSFLHRPYPNPLSCILYSDVYPIISYLRSVPGVIGIFGNRTQPQSPSLFTVSPEISGDSICKSGAKK